MTHKKIPSGSVSRPGSPAMLNNILGNAKYRIG
jgi:hypothetical protein